MKVYRLEFIDTGEYYVLTEKELYNEYSQKEIKLFENDDMVIFKELSYTIRQLTQARKKYNDTEFQEWYEEEYGCQPSLYDVLQEFYS